MVPFRSLSAVSYSHFIPTMAAHCIISEIKQDIGRKSRLLSRISILTRDIDIANPSVRPSVCLFVRNVPVSDENGLTYRHSFLTIRSIILVLPASNIFTKSDRVTRFGGANYRWGRKISRFYTNKSLYLANDTKYRHSYYGRRIETRMRSIKWCHFQ